MANQPKKQQNLEKSWDNQGKSDRNAHFVLLILKFIEFAPNNLFNQFLKGKDPSNYSYFIRG